MRRYALVVTVLLALIAALGLPPRTRSVSFWSRMEKRTPERTRFLELQNEMLREMWLYQRIQWRDSVSEVLTNLDPAETPFVLEVPSETSEEDLTRLREGVTRHLAHLDALPPAVPVGVFLIPKAAKSHPAALTGRLGVAWSRREFYVGRDPDRPFCGLVEPVGEIGNQTPTGIIRRLVFLPQDPNQRPNALRICGYYAKYGVPGSQIEKWLHHGASAFAAGARNVDPRLAYLIDPEEGPRGPFGRWTPYWGLSVTGMGCLAGVETACRRAFLTPGSRSDGWRPASWFTGSQISGSPVDFFGTRYVPFGGDFGAFEPHILETLEDQFGPQRFREFWASPAPVPEAFLTAFDTPIETWVQGWARRRFGATTRGPRVPASGFLWSALSLGILTGAAIHLGRRQA